MAGCCRFAHTSFVYEAVTPPAAIGIWSADSPAAAQQAPSERVSDTQLYAPHGIGIPQRHGSGL